MAVKNMGVPSYQHSSEWEELVASEIEAQLHSATQTADEWALIQRKLAALRTELFPYQLKFLSDPAKKKAVSAPRRTGKTFTVRQAAAEAVAAKPWLNPRKAQPVVQYVAQTQKKALDLFWKPFKQICAEVGMKAHFDDHNLRAEFSNGVLVRAAGVNTGFDIENYRGDAYTRVILDEVGSYGPKVESLVQEAFGMAMADYSGDLWAISSPGRVKAGYFYQIISGKRPEEEGWSVHPGWSFLDNLSIAESERSYDWVRRNVGPLDSAKVRREAFGEWVTDANTLVYRFIDDNFSSEPQLPAGHEWRFVLGVDLGWHDPTAFVVVAYSSTHQTAFVVHAESHQHLLPSQQVEKIVRLNQEFGGFYVVAVDTGGSNARNTYEEWVRRFPHLPFRPANKAPGYKYGAIEHLNSDLHVGSLKVLKGRAEGLVQEWRELPWDEDDTASDTAYQRHDRGLKEHSGFANHESDACLYAFMECRHYRSKKQAPKTALAHTPAVLQSLNDRYLADRWARATQKSAFTYNKLKQGR